MIIIVLLLGFYGFTGWLTVGASMAFYISEWPRLNSYREYRNDLAFAFFYALIPLIGLVVVFFSTGFYQSGFCWSYKAWLGKGEKAQESKA